MLPATVAELAVLGLVVAILASILVDDLRHYRIRNTSVLMLSGLFLVWCVIKASLMILVSHIAAAAVVFVILAVLYRFNLLGGGDVKLLTVAFLWLGMEHGFLFSVLLCVISLLYTASAQLKWVPSKKGENRTTMPFGPSIALAWITTIIIAQVPKVLA